MKKIIIAILVLISVQSFGQMKLYGIKCNTNGTIDSIYLKRFTDSLFINGNFVQFSKEHFYGDYEPVYPNGFEHYTQRADDIWINNNCLVNNGTIIPTLIDDALDGKANLNHTHTVSDLSNASTVGLNLLGVSTPPSNSLIVINSSGTPILRTETQIKQDLLINNVTNESKATMFTNPAFTGTPTGIGIPVYAWVNGINVTTTGQALVDITGLSIPLTINARYEIEVIMSVSTSAVTTGTGYGINYSVAGGSIEAHVTGSLTSTATKTVRLNALNTAATPYLTTSGQTGGIRIRGMITTGANAGNITVQHRKETSGTSTIFSNSYIKVTRIQ